MGYPALQAGWVMAPRGLGSVVAMPLVGQAIERTDPRRLVALGFLISGVTMYWLGTLDLNPASGTSSGPSSSRASAWGCSSCP
jgi:DHA2 family multidrug resistance protein